MNVYHPKATASVWLLGMLVVGILAIQVLSKDWLETSFLVLLPASEQRPEVAKAMQQHNALLNCKVIWLAGASTSLEAIAHAQGLKQQLDQSKLFNKVMLQVSPEQAIKQYQQLFAYRYQLLDTLSQALLKSSPEALLQQNLEILHSPLGQMQAVNFEHDPLLLFSRYFSTQNPIKLNLEQGVVILTEQNKFWALLVTELQDEQLQLDKLEVLLSLVKDTTEHVKMTGGELLVSGMPLFTAQGAEASKKEISTVGLGSSIGIIILLWTTFRSVRPLLLSAVAIGSGLLVALVGGVMVFGKIHIITLIFGASLIGVADDYAQHYLCDSFGEQDWNPRTSLRFILPGLFWGLLSNLLCYAGLGFSPFPGLQQVALFSAIGLLGAWLTVVLLFPWLLTGFKFEHKPVILKLTTFWEQKWPLWVLKNRPYLGLILFAFVLTGLWKLTPQDDVRLLQSAPAELTATADKIRHLFPMSPDSQFFLVAGANPLDWYKHEQLLAKALEQLQQQNKLQHFEALSNYWPNAQQQSLNYQLLKQTLYDSGEVAHYMTKLGFEQQAINAELAQFVTAKSNILPFSAWLASTDANKQSLWVGCSANLCQSIVTLTGITDAAALSALQVEPNVSWINQVESISALFARYRIKASGLLGMAFCLAFTGLAIKQGWRNALSIMSVPMIALAVSLAMLGWFNQLFSLFNLFALLLVLGIGVDYGLFFFMAGSRRVSTSLGVTLSALTTLLAFGLLATSTTEIVHAFGFTITPGILTALLVAPLVGFKKDKNAKQI